MKVWRPQLDKWSESTLQGSWLKKDTPRQLSFADQGYEFMAKVFNGQSIVVCYLLVGALHSFRQCQRRLMVALIIVAR